ncbi:MAG: zinc ABC transporter substrate-binding protein [Clostridia bacterium]|nr:zinc ABC transporter substrate-binding protein [Clostridia bacterium]
MKKHGLIAAFVVFALSVFLFAGCTGGADKKDEGGEGLTIVATIFPEYDWAKNILGERAGEVSVKLLIHDGTDMHSFQPSADDIIEISTCDIFIYVGGESDAWVKDALSEAVNEDMTVVNLMEVLGDAAKEEEAVLSTEPDGDGDEPEYDEHVWLSIKNAVIFCGAIEKAISEKDPEYADVYAANAADYKEKLYALDEKYEETIENAPGDTLLFGDRFPFRYLTEDYGLKYYAAFNGCSAETEASFETVMFLSDKLKELNLPVVLTIDGGNERLAQTIIETSGKDGVAVMSLDSMQASSNADEERGLTYISVMEQNLEVIKAALS